MLDQIEHKKGIAVGGLRVIKETKKRTKTLKRNTVVEVVGRTEEGGERSAVSAVWPGCRDIVMS